MLYHYFGDKEDLFREVLGRKLRERVAWMATAPDDPGESLTFWLAIACRDRDWVRLLQWEALGEGDARVLLEGERRRAVSRGIDRLRDQQAGSLLSPDLEPRHLMLAMTALTTFPVAFSQITRLVTGRAPDDPAFERHWAMFLRRFAQSLKPEPRHRARLARVRHGGRA